MVVDAFFRVIYSNCRTQAIFPEVILKIKSTRFQYLLQSVSIVFSYEIKFLIITGPINNSMPPLVVYIPGTMSI